jgi:nucleoside-diphosphate-sugar epimerase
MQTILGANGTIAKDLAKELLAYTKDIRLVSRNPKKINADDQIFAADLNIRDQVEKAVEGSEIVYLTAGIKYNIKDWREQWPRIMENVVLSCEKAKARLLFFDNVYSYGRVDGKMTEETPYNPCSKKGEVRVKIANFLMDEVKKGNLQAQIARAADFYGPDNKTSFAHLLIFENLNKGKKAQWMVDSGKKHSLTYTPDASKATAILGNTESAYGQVWHLPTDPEALTGKEIMHLAAEALGKEPRSTTMPRWMLRMAGIFVPEIAESMEMLYQYDSDYLFDSSKFDKAFDFKTTTYQQGIQQVAESMKS